MSKSSALAQSSARGGFNVLWGMVVSAIISAVGTIIVGNALGEDFGLISIVLSGPLMINSIRDFGINQSIIKYANQFRAENNPEKLKNIVLVGTSFNVILGLIFTLTSFLLSGVMANLLERPTLVPLIQIASLVILAEGLVKAVHAVLIGYEKMALHSLTLVIHSLLKTGLMVLLVVMSFGVYGALIGQIVAYCAAGLVGFALLYFVIIANLRKQEYPFQFLSTIKTMLRFGLPLSIVMMLSGVLGQFYVFMTAIYASDIMISDYAMAINFGTLVSVFATSVATVMFPTFSKIRAKNDPQTLQSVFQYSVKYTSLLIVPLTFAVIALSTPGVQALFQNKFELTPLFMSLYSLNFLYSAIGNLSAGALIKSQGKTQINMKVSILTFVIGIVMCLVLIPTFQVFGLLATHVFAGLPGLLIALWWVHKNYNAGVDWISSIKILGISAFSATVTYFVINQFNLTSWVGLLVGAPVFLGTYVVAAPLIGAITYVDTKILKDAVKSLGPLAIVIDVLLYPIEKIAKSKLKTKT